jgi:hypothetical protein
MKKEAKVISFIKDGINQTQIGASFPIKHYVIKLVQEIKKIKFMDG